MDFALIMLLALVATGVVWLLDRLVGQPGRRRRIETLRRSGAPAAEVEAAGKEPLLDPFLDEGAVGADDEDVTVLTLERRPLEVGLVHRARNLDLQLAKRRLPDLFWVQVLYFLGPIVVR